MITGGTSSEMRSRSWSWEKEAPELSVEFGSSGRVGSFDVTGDFLDRCILNTTATCCIARKVVVLLFSLGQLNVAIPLRVPCGLDLDCYVDASGRSFILFRRTSATIYKSGVTPRPNASLLLTSTCG